MQRVDRRDHKYGRLTVLRRVPSNNNHLRWLCRCSCGEEVSVQSSNLSSGNTKSCGCLQKELTALRFTTHGQRQTKEYVIWADLRKRCRNKKWKDYKNYGGRGITVCDRWERFENFLEDMGLRPEGLSIDRINNDGNYEPDNCRWATSKQQNRNRRSSHLLSHRGETHCIVEWAEILDINAETLYTRINKLKWPIEKALQSI